MAENSENNAIALHNTPEFYVASMKEQVEQMRIQKRTDVEIAYMTDIYEMLKIAAGVLAPMPLKEMN